MGELFFFPLGDLIKTFGADTFFETGTGYGFGVQHSRMFTFKRILSVEIVAAEVERLRLAFRVDPRVELFCGNSTDIMKQTLPQIAGNIIFWLDAHYPNCYDQQVQFDAEKDLDVRLPLEKELSLIKQLRPGNRDVILIDDLRIYEKDNFEAGNLSDFGHDQYGKFDSGFLYSTFKETHDAHRFLNQTGFLALTPKLPAAPA
jgi:hypothetical protein